MVSYRIVKEYDHYVVYINGYFYCSADNINEATLELSEYFDSKNE